MVPLETRSVISWVGGLYWTINISCNKPHKSSVRWYFGQLLASQMIPQLKPHCVEIGPINVTLKLLTCTFANRASVSWYHSSSVNPEPVLNWTVSFLLLPHFYLHLLLHLQQQHRGVVAEAVSYIIKFLSCWFIFLLAIWNLSFWKSLQVCRHEVK